VLPQAVDNRTEREILEVLDRDAIDRGIQRQRGLDGPPDRQGGQTAVMPESTGND
jgi:hypothetical protein